RARYNRQRSWSAAARSSSGGLRGPTRKNARGSRATSTPRRTRSADPLVSRRQGGKQPRVMGIPLPPMITGQPLRIKYLQRATADMQKNDAVWFATGGGGSSTLFTAPLPPPRAR